MAIGETMVTLVGTMTSDPMVKRAGHDRHELVIFWVRSDERRFDRHRREWVPGRRFSVRVVCRRGSAAALRRGDPVVVNGRLNTGDPDIDGSRAQLDLEAFALGPNLAQCGVSLRRTPRPEPDVPHQIPLWEAAGLVAETLENEAVGAPAPVPAGSRRGRGP